MKGPPGAILTEALLEVTSRKLWKAIAVGCVKEGNMMTCDDICTNQA